MKVKEESEKVGLKLNIQKTKIMASGPITSWEIDGETVETVSDFIFGGSKITADGDCNHDIKRRLLLGTGTFGLGIQNEAGQRLIEFCQEKALVIANTLFQQHKKVLHMDITRWSTLKLD